MVSLVGLSPILSTVPSDGNNSPGSQIVDIGNGEYIELAPGEQLHRYVLSEQGWVEWSGESSELSASEFGNSSVLYSELTMMYLPTNTTTNTTLEISTGENWEGYEVSADITNLLENRTWTSNPEFNGITGWTLGTTSGGGYSSETSQYNASGHGAGDGCVDFFIDSNSGGAPYYYSAGDQAWVQQTMNIPRGTVTWAGFRTDYWADTRDDTHYGMTGTFSVYVEIESSVIWETVFSDIGAEETWYDTGMVTVPTNTFNLPGDQNVLLEMGLWSKGSYGYAPNILPAAKFDNFELYVKTFADPTDLNLEMNGNAVVDSGTWGSGSIVETPSVPWTNDPIPLNFTWLPTPVNPDPNRTIVVEFDATINMFARRLDFGTVNEINPTAVGERFMIQNGTDASYTTYFYANIPTGYVNRYFYNVTLPSSRDVNFVARPLAPSTNLTSGWSGGEPGDGYLNVSAYDVATDAGRYGYWRILSSSPNMISDIEIWDPNLSTWSRNVDLRAGNTSRIRVNVGAAFQNSIANITVYDPSGAKWYSVNATADGAGYATTDFLTFSGSNSSAGSWMVQATTNDIGTNSDWRSTGFFKRPFSVTHESELILEYPTDAIGTWTTNATFGDLLLIVLTANDTESSVLISGGTLSLDWAAGTDTFDDSGNGQYTKVVDTSALPGKGLFAMDLEWSRTNFDNSTATLYIHVNYPATLTSPEYPGISGPIGTDQAFTVDFKNVNGTGITGASVWCNWSGAYGVTPLGLGSYSILLDVSGVPFGQYPILVNASASYVESQSMLMYVEVREIYSTISYSASELAIPVGEAASFTLTWTDSESGLPITGGASFISSNWTSFHSVGEQNYTISETSPGIYNITIYTESDDPLTVGDERFTVTFDVMRQFHQNHTFNIAVQIRSHNTLFELDDPVQQTEYGTDIYVLVFFQDTDLLEGISNGTGFVKITVTSPGVASLQYTSAPSSFGTGHFNITIPSSQWGEIGWHNLTIYVDWIGPVSKYFSQSIDTSVRILGTDTDLYLELAPTATYYLDEFVFTAVYWDVVNGTRISNATNDIELVITPLTGGHPVVQSDFNIIELGISPGTYEFRLDSSLFLATGAFVFQIDFGWSSGVVPLYENQTITVTLLVLDQPTHVDYAPVQTTPYGEIVTFEFYFVDTLGSVYIQDSAELSIDLVEGGIPYGLAYDGGTRLFTITFNNTYLGGTGVFVLHINVTWTGVPFYQNVLLQAFTVTVSERTTQLTHLSFAPGQWGNNVSIEFIYTDLESGTSSGMTGVLTLNISGTYYTVYSLGNGHYEAVLNTSVFASAGQYWINASIAYTGIRYASDAFEVFGFSVLMRSTQMGYESPDPTPYLANVTFVVSFIDDSTALGISGASIIVDCANSSQALVLNTNYWVQYLGLGEYRVEVNSTALGSLGAFVLEVSVTYSGAPFYNPANRDVNSRVVERTTQILITQTPGEVPFLENVTFRFKFQDFLTGVSIIIDKSDISLTHGPVQTVIPSGSYSLFDFGTYYEIQFNSTILAGTLVIGHEIGLTIDTGSGAPFYAARSTTTVVTTVSRPTQILFPLVDEVPFGDNITIVMAYTDYLSGNGIDGANVIIECSNLTIFTSYITPMGSGVYEIIVPTGQFGGAGSISFNLTLSKAGVPFFSTRQASDIPASIRLILTSLLAETPAAGRIPIGDPIIVNLTLTDFDHGVTIAGATITTDWESKHGTTATILEIGNGIYRITINTTSLLSQAYIFTVQAELNNYATANITVEIQPGSATVEIFLSRTAYFASWGQNVTIAFDVIEPYYSTYVPGMNATLVLNGTLYYFVDHDNGTYTLDLPSGDTTWGIYEPQITVTREFYSPRQKSFTLIISKANGQLLPERTDFSVVVDTTLNFWVYFNDTTSNAPVSAGIITIEWNNTLIPMTFNGTPGFYEGIVDMNGFVIGPYELVLTAVAPNHVVLDLPIDIFIVPIPSQLNVYDDATSFTVRFGDSLDILVDLNDTYYGGGISGADVHYILGPLTGDFVELPNGSYLATIDISTLPAQTLYLRIIASLEGFASSQRTLPLTILPVTTDAFTDDVLLTGHFDDTLVFRLNYTDTTNNVLIPGATVDATWDGGSGIVTDLGNGYYTVTIFLNLTTPRLYDLTVQFSKVNYESSTVNPSIVILSTLAEIESISMIDVPVNDSANIVFNVRNQRTNETIEGLIGTAVIQQGSVNITEIGLAVLENGSYVLEIPDNLRIGTYDVYVDFITSVYTIPSSSLVLVVRRVATEVRVDRDEITTFPGETITIRVTYFDLDHNVGISGVEPTVIFEALNISYLPSLTTEPNNNGTYELHFLVNGQYTFSITVEFSYGSYVTATKIIAIQSNPSALQEFVQTAGLGVGLTILALVGLIAAYVRIWSVPKLIRAMNRMIRDLKRGKIPKPADVPQRKEMVLAIINEEIKPSGLRKTHEDIIGESIEAHVPEVNELLERLAEITGLGEVEIEAFRADLARMKASERPGFLKEVIEQEEARRADLLAGKEEDLVADAEVLLESLPEEMENIRKKLVEKGMAPEEIDIILEEAKTLSKPDLDALLDSLGIRLD
jgi:hypothetical protein